MSEDFGPGERVLIYAPAGRDAPLAQRVLADSSIDAFVCPDIAAFCRELADGAAAGLITEAALPAERRAPLVEALAQQPVWADFPIILLASRARMQATLSSFERALVELRNVTVLERPLATGTLLGTVHAALRARRRQYQTRELLTRLEQAVEERDRFLATLSHELRNPLGAIRNAVHLTSRNMPSGSPVERPMAIVHRQVTHLARLIDDLLDVSRVTTGKVILNSSLVDFGAIVRQAVQQLEPEFEQAGLRVFTGLGRRPLRVVGDPMRLEQVCTNLLTNSIKYTPREGRVEVTAGSDDDTVWLRVLDTGIGLEPQMLTSIFDMFSQADSSLARSQGGMGIGLTLVKSLVGLHGGTVTAMSAGLGRGSEFAVRLPRAIAEDRAETLEASRPHARCDRGRGRVLLVEDNDDNREMLRDLLELDGFEVDVACDGSQGVERALSSKPDIAIVDIGLPVMDGYEVARKVRAVLGRDIQLVALTGYGQPEDRHRTHAAGFDAHLTKPVNLEDLEAALLRRREPSSGTPSRV